MEDETAELELLELNDKQREILMRALDGYAQGDPRTRAALRRRGLLDDADNITDLGRYQVRWYADDCARTWGIETNTWHQYVKRGTAPAATARGTFGSSTDRPWWDPQTVINFVRPTSAHRRGQHTVELSEIDMQTVVRRFRSGESVRSLAKAYNVAGSTLAARLEELGEKPETTASRTERARRMAGNNPTDWTY